MMLRPALLAGAAALALARPAAAQTPAVSCANLPARAVRSVPAPFDARMRLVCRDPLGQGLQAVEGMQWVTPDGQPIGLSATSAAGGTEPDGSRRFPTSWYVALSPVSLSLDDQRGLRRDFRRGIKPQVLDRADILEFRARTSNGEEKLIFLIFPHAGPGEPASMLGLECNGACFRKDPAPLMFSGAPG